MAVGQADGDQDWIQVGADIDGETAGDRSGESVAMSSDGTRIAISALTNDGNGSNSGHVRVYDFDGSTWNQIGTDIDGETPWDRSGDSVAMSSDGNRIAIGATRNNGNGNADSGHVRVFDFDGTNWNQAGTDIDGETPGDQSGQSVAMSSDGNRIAIGAPLNDGNGASSGHVRVYNFDGTNWNQAGTDIDGETAGDRSGFSVAMSNDGNRIAIGAFGNGNLDANGVSAGHVRVFGFDGTNWNQAGTDIDGETPGDQSGRVAMSNDGNRVAIGAALADGTGNGNGFSSGHVRVFDFDGTNWNQAGTDIDGEASGDRSGDSVAMSSDGNRVVIGATLADGTGNGNGFSSGHVRVFDFDGTNWNQAGTDIDGEARSDYSAESVAMSGDGTFITIGAPFNDGDGGTNSGHARVYELASSETPFTNGDVIVLRNVATGRYLDGDGAGRGAGVNTSVRASEDDRWQLTSTEAGTWSLRNQQHALYLDADGSGANWDVDQSVNSGADDQWEILDNGNGTYLVRNTFYDRYLAQAATPNDTTNAITVAEADINNRARWEITIDA